MPSVKVVQNIGSLAGIARPSDAMKKILSVQTPVELGRYEVAVDAFARLLTEAMEKNQTRDGRVDMRDVAAFVLGEMKRNQK